MFHVKIQTITENKLSKYIMIKKISFILGEFFIYLFSDFSKDKDKTNLIYLIKDFIDQHVLIQNPDYSIIPSSIINIKTMIKCGYYKDDKIIVKNNETLKRLICLLRLRMLNDYQKVNSYYESKEFYDFYKEISDFQSFDNILLYTSDLSKIENYDTTVYYTFQNLAIYYLIIKGKLYLSKKIKDEIDQSEYFIIVYNQELEKIIEKGDESHEKIIMIEYMDNSIKKYQHLFLL